MEQIVVLFTSFTRINLELFIMCVCVSSLFSFQTATCLSASFFALKIKTGLIFFAAQIVRWLIRPKLHEGNVTISRKMKVKYDRQTYERRVLAFIYVILQLMLIFQSLLDVLAPRFCPTSS